MCIRDRVQYLHARWHGDEHRRDREGDDRDRTDAGHEHVMSPYAPTHEPDSDTGEHHCAVAEDWLTAEGWDDLGDDAEARKDEDVHLRVTEDPEEVLPKQWVSASFGVEEVCTEEAVEGQLKECDRDDRNSKEQQELHDEVHPGEDRHAEQAHALRAHVQHGDDQVDRRYQRGETGDLETQCVEVDAVGW